MGRFKAQSHDIHLSEQGGMVLQVFFVDDKTMPGWSVVVKKEARGRRIKSTEDDYGLGQEASADDLQVLQTMEFQRGVGGEGIGSEEAGDQPTGRRRRRIVEVL